MPEFPMIDDSWRKSLLSSADSSFVTDDNNSLNQMSNSGHTLDTGHAAVSLLSSTPVCSNLARCIGTADSESLSTPQYNSDGQKCHGKHRLRTRHVGHMSDNSDISSSCLLRRRRRQLKRCMLSTPQPVSNDNVEWHTSPGQELLKQNQSQTLPFNNNTNTELGEIHSRRRQRLKRRLAQADSDNHVETVPLKQRKLSASKMVGDAAVLISQPKMRVLKPKMRDKITYSDMHIAFTSGVNTVLTNSTAVANSASCHPQLTLQNVSTGTCYHVQPVKRAVNPSTPAADVQGVALNALPVSKGANTDNCRLILPASCRIGMMSRPLSTSANTKRQASASKAAIPRLVRVPASHTLSSDSSSISTASSFTSKFLKHCSSQSVTVSSPSSGSSTIPSSSGASVVARSILKQNHLQKSASVSLPSTSTTTCGTQSISSQEQLFRTQMILFQHKQDITSSNAPSSGKTHLLEIISNCAWEHIRPKVLARLSELAKNSDHYPQICVMSVDGFRLEVLPKSKEPTVIPLRLQASLGISSMFAVRVRITAEVKSGTTCSISVPPVLCVTKSSPKQKVYNGLNVGSVLGVSLDGTKHGTASTDITRQKSNSLLARHATGETSIAHVSHPATDALDISQQDTNIDTSPPSTPVAVGQHMPSGVYSSELSSKDNTSMSKSHCPGDDSVTEPSSSVDTATQDVSDCYIVDHCNDSTGSDMSDRINYNSSVENSGSCTALLQQVEDTPLSKHDGNSVGTECSEVANSCFNASDDQNFVPSSDDVNFPSSSSLSVPIAHPLDLRM